MKNAIQQHNMYRIGEWGRAHRDFKAAFGVGTGKFYDGLATLILKKISIDLFKFDDFLHAKHGAYEAEGLTMEELVRREYGDKGVALLKELL